ncbi:MAG: M56 family metallopeptidase [Bacteroidota bacterium]
MNTFLESQLAEALTWTLLHSIWQGLVLWLLLVVVLKMTNMKSPSGRYVSGIMAMFTWLCWMCITLFQQIDTSAATIYEAGDITFAYDIQEEATAHFFHGEEHASLYEIQYWFQDIVFEYGSLFNLIWLSGFIIFGLKWVSGWMYVQYLKKSAYLIAEEHWREKLDILLKKMDIGKDIQILASDHVMSPILVGHIKPIILFPAALLTGLQPEHLEAIISHELAHVKRHDYLVNIVISGMEMILFYHPAYWWMANMIKKERELCCDDMAVSVIKSPLKYAEALAEVQSYEQSAVSLAMGIQGSNKQFLLGRVRRLLTPSLEKETSHQRPWLSFLLVAGLFMGIWGITSSPLTAAEDNHVNLVAAWEEGMMDSFEESWEEEVWEEIGVEEEHSFTEEFGTEPFPEMEELALEIHGQWIEERFGEVANIFDPEIFVMRLDSPIIEAPEAPEKPEVPELPEMEEFPEAPEMPEMPEIGEMPEFPEAPEMEMEIESRIQEEMEQQMVQLQEHMQLLQEQYENMQERISEKAERLAERLEREEEKQRLALEEKQMVLENLALQYNEQKSEGEVSGELLRKMEMEMRERKREMHENVRSLERFPFHILL